VTVVDPVWDGVPDPEAEAPTTTDEPGTTDEAGTTDD